MNFQKLLHQRDALLRQARLANVAYASQRLSDFAARAAGAPLRGLVRLHVGDPAGDHPWPALTALECSQSVIEEYFLDEEIVELVDIFSFLGEEVDETGVTFRWEEFEARCLPGLRRELEAAGIALDPPNTQPTTPDLNRGRE